MRPNRADSALSQYFCSLLTAVLLLVSLLCGLIFFATTRTFAASVLSSSEKESQHKTEWNAAQIQADFALSDAALAPLSGACAAYQAELAVYWHDFFRTDAEELPAAPAPLDEREMVALVMADEGFQARVDADFRRATARDEVVYPLSQFVQRYSFPIRQSLMELLGGLAAQKCSLPRLLHAVEISGAVCLLAAILLLLCCRRVRIGATLTATGLAALLLLLPALLLNLPGLLHPLSTIAQAQVTRALLLLGGAQAVFALVTLLPGILLLREGTRMMQKNTITVTSDKITQPLTFAFSADFHNGDADEALSLMRGCDAILIGGDLVNRHSRHGWRNAARFLDLAPRVAPTFYNLGNHERLLPDIAEYLPLLQKSDVTVLDDCFVDFRGITLGGVSSARKMPGMPPVRAQMDAKKPFLQAMAARDGFKLLLCHHPEYFAPLVQGLDIDLTLAGHAHGGQVRIGSQGVYSPGQGLFPKLTSGFYFDDKLFISRGMTNSACAPRLWCPCELVMVQLLPNRAI